MKICYSKYDLYLLFIKILFSMIYKILDTKSSDIKQIISSKKNVVVQFTAAWCGPCKMIKPSLQEIGEKDEDIEIVSVDIDSYKDLSNEYNVRSIPMFIFYKNGVEFEGRVVGSNLNDIREKINLMKNSN